MKHSRLLSTIVVFLLGFALALVAAKYMFATSEPEAPPARTLSADEMRPLVAAADSGDFAALSRLGDELLLPGTIIPDSGALLEEYAVPSFAPHQVYALLTRIGGDVSQRVLLTMNEENRVVSFMAEETPVSR